MKRVGIVALIGVGCIVIYMFWSSFLELPKLGTVEEASLEEVSGKEFSVKGKPMLVTFFYTKCPDVCPFTIQDLKKLQHVLKEKGITENQYSILSVTLDPKHDTAKTILQYKAAFDITSSNWLFLRGSEQEIKSYAKQFNMFYEKSGEGGITHSTSMYVVDSSYHIRARHDMATGTERVDIEKVADHLIQLTK
ncbi:SCO family protein [Domibacillus sp. A3M-37]|uniref:SCO family protein n=1 Tax=Domibacillus sp. A3M-37 TaxID=2962037 RepID=UPI0020B6E17D|nr:SCO family protein [Domibacillus sp. A3M-37]MCP3762341.1 SCO family protein [Domibacillus sp. A3M-37]